MSHSFHDAPISPLRQRLIDDITLRRSRQKAQCKYLRDGGRFASFLGRQPDTATADDMRRFQVWQQEDGVRTLRVPSAVTSSVSMPFGGGRLCQFISARLRCSVCPLFFCHPDLCFAVHHGEGENGAYTLATVLAGSFCPFRQLLEFLINRKRL